MRRHLIVISACLACTGGALAAEAVAKLGDASVRFDAARWKATVRAGAIHFEPRGQAMRSIDPVTLHVVDDGTPCPELARGAFAIGLYDEDDLIPVATRIGGREGIRMQARTGCRNATPLGAAACVAVGGRAYLLHAVQPDCGGRNLFSGIDPLDEIAGGISFR